MSGKAFFITVVAVLVVMVVAVYFIERHIKNKK